MNGRERVAYDTNIMYDTIKKNWFLTISGYRIVPFVIFSKLKLAETEIFSRKFEENKLLRAFVCGLT